MEFEKQMQELKEKFAQMSGDTETSLTAENTDEFDEEYDFDEEQEDNGAENENIPKLKRSVVTNVEVNYAPNGWTTHDDGAPVQTTLTINFKEIVLVDSDKVKQGY